MNLPVLPNLHPAAGRRFMAIFRRFVPTGPDTKRLEEVSAPINVTFVEHSDGTSSYSWTCVNFSDGIGRFGGATWRPTPRAFSTRLVADLGPIPPPPPHWYPRPGMSAYTVG